MFNEELKSKAANILNIYKSLICQNWIRLINENIVSEDKTTLKFSAITMEKLIESFIMILSSENYELDRNFSNSIACELAYKDISYENFMEIINYFEESCIFVLSKKISSNDVIKCLMLINSICNKAIASISEEYFSVKDTTVIALVKLAELRDDVTGAHLERAREYAALLSKELGLDDNYIKNIERASLLHDIGKIGIKDSILLKPGKLTKEEFEEIKQHTIIGARTIYEIVKSTNFVKDYLAMAINIALHHHEKYDGSGYPHGLKQEQIPLEARIFALADAYDAIVSKRQYKEPETHHEAVRRIVLDSGKHFDPVVVESFVRIQDKFNIINDKHKEGFELQVI